MRVVGADDVACSGPSWGHQWRQSGSAAQHGDPVTDQMAVPRDEGDTERLGQGERSGGIDR